MKTGSLVPLLSTSTLFLLNLQESVAFTSFKTVTKSVPPSYCDLPQLSFSSTSLFAKQKKKGGGAKKKQKDQKKSGFAWASSFALKPFESSSLRELASFVCASFEGRTGKPLSEELKGTPDLPKALWNAPVACVVVVNGAEKEQEGISAANSIVQYANIAALETFGFQPDQFDQLISSKDPESGEWKTPQNDVAKGLNFPSSMNGDNIYQSDYKKKVLRADPDISIKNAHRWRLEKSSLIGGKFVTESIGVAYAWNSWLEGEDTLCRPGGFREVKMDTAELEQKIKTQGEAIRELKEVQGFGNKDKQVVDAVQELLRMKALLEEVTSSSQ
uniref:WHEP-TRS domain-containing protein n=2 Tax=Ditylum brightwellii TaxID=49249 RepID=A0A6U3Q5K3_9STRA|mmetsp:Transcript_17518/g.26084  ORF Transcript_17518/g.26084 Transcript_17518/m.26084 type:complete len:330 (+) Transcript_17518:69-1058(+)